MTQRAGPDTAIVSASARSDPLGRARAVMLGFALTLAMITYVDRVAIAQAKPDIAAELHLSNTQMGMVFSAFAWAYGIFEIPGGWWADRFGPRSLLTRIVLWWSFFTAATGWVSNFGSLLIARFLFGAGEAGCFPGVTRMFANWLTGDARVRAQSAVWWAARWSGAFTPLLVVWVLGFVSWRRAFEIFGAVGVVWAVLFGWWFRDRPEEKVGQAFNPPDRTADAATGSDAAPSMSPDRAGGRAVPEHLPVPWRRWAANRSVWLLCAQYLLLSVGFWLYISWLPTYLREGRGLAFEPEKAALLAGLPLFFAGVSCLVSGQVLTWLSHRLHDTRRARRILALTGFTGAGLCLLCSLRLADPVWAMVAMGCAGFCNDMAMPGSWAACMDMGGRYAGTLAGTMNTAGSVGAAISPLLVGLLLDLTSQNWTVPLVVIAAAYLVGGLCWLGIDPVTELADSES